MVHNGIEYGLMQAYAEGFDTSEMRRSIPCQNGIDSNSTLGILRKFGGTAALYLLALDLAAMALARHSIR
jgi:6-phosphogluconate dehydrogenase (decarboxylating)